MIFDLQYCEIKELKKTKIPLKMYWMQRCKFCCSL